MSSHSTPVRRSRRERKSNIHYNDRVSWDEAIRLLRAESDSPDRSSGTSTPEVIEREVDSDIDEDVAMRDAAERDEDDEMDDAASSDIPAVDEDETDVDKSKWKIDVTPMTYKKKFVPRPRTKALQQEKGIRNRMITEDISKLRWNKQRAWTEVFGPQLEDMYPMIRSRDIWHVNERDVVLPSRRSTKLAIDMDAQGKYLKSQTPTLAQGQAQHEASPPGTILPELDEHSFQQLSPLTDGEIINGVYLDKPFTNEIVIGLWEQDAHFDLKPGVPFNMAEKLHDLQANGDSERQQSQPPPALHTTVGQPDLPPGNLPHRGWLINLGARPQCIGWTPSTSDTQHLAVSFRCTKEQRKAAPPRPSKLSPAFSPSPTYPSYIQIWQVKATPGNSNEPARLSHAPAHSPQLPLRLCMKWGNVHRFEWLPLPPSLPSHSRQMAILSSDGNLRIITIDLRISGNHEITSPHLVASPPSHTVFTAFSLPSAYDLIVGGADGAIRLYNLSSATSATLEPYHTIQLHNTYIMALSCASDYPHFLASASASGDMQLVDLRAPHQDRVRLHKSRLPTRNLSYLPHTRSFLSTSDASGNSEPHGTSLSTLIAHNLRHFYKTSTILKLPEMQGIAGPMASSSFHPFVLCSNTAGQVFATNVLRRQLPNFAKGEEAQGWMVKLFEIDWIPLAPLPSDQANESGFAPGYSFVDPVATNHTEKIDVYHGNNMRPGLTRIYDSFRPVPIELNTFGMEGTNPRKTGNKESRKKEGVPSAASYQCVYHEEQAVTAMTWNPNPRFSTWAALSWGSGILWVGDLGHGVV